MINEQWPKSVKVFVHLLLPKMYSPFEKYLAAYTNFIFNSLIYHQKNLFSFLLHLFNFAALPNSL